MQIDAPKGSGDVNAQHSFWNGNTWWSVGGLWWWDGSRWQPFDTYAAGMLDRRLRKRQQRKRLIFSLLAAAAGAVLLVVVLVIALAIGYMHNVG